MTFLQPVNNVTGRYISVKIILLRVIIERLPEFPSILNTMAKLLGGLILLSDFITVPASSSSMFTPMYNLLPVKVKKLYLCKVAKYGCVLCVRGDVPTRFFHSVVKLFPQWNLNRLTTICFLP